MQRLGVATICGRSIVTRASEAKFDRRSALVVAKVGMAQDRRVDVKRVRIIVVGEVEVRKAPVDPVILKSFFRVRFFSHDERIDRQTPGVEDAGRDVGRGPRYVGLELLRGDRRGRGCWWEAKPAGPLAQTDTAARGRGYRRRDVGTRGACDRMKVWPEVRVLETLSAVLVVCRGFLLAGLRPCRSRSGIAEVE